MSEFDAAARYYDAIYAGKDYEAEARAADALVRAELGLGPWRVLDAGCGTGTHALALAALGHHVTGVDRSPAMLAVAREKAQGAVRFVEGDIRHLELHERFDVVTCLFAVMSYQLTMEDVAAALGSFRRHLVDGGLLVFDVWYGPGVLAIGPVEKHLTAMLGSRRIERAAIPAGLDPVGRRNSTRYRFRVYDGDTLVDEVEEVHTVRYFFLDELLDALARSGFEVTHVFTEWDLARRPDETTWTAVIAARGPAAHCATGVAIAPQS